MALESHKAVDIAADTTKQVITLSLGLLTLNITFAKQVLNSLGSIEKLFVQAGWAWLFFAIVFGVATLMSIAGACDRAIRNEGTPSIYEGPIRITAGFQLASFLLGILCIGLPMVSSAIF